MNHSNNENFDRNRGNNANDSHHDKQSINSAVHAKRADDIKYPKDLDELVLDRLVDNDLSPTEYRAVLKLVEEKPDGWRRLAIAFLESQALENELSELRGDDTFLSIGLVDENPAFDVDKSETTQRNISEAKVHETKRIALNPYEETTAKSAQFTAQFKAQTIAGKNTASTSRSSVVENSALRSLKHALPAVAACLIIGLIAIVYVREMQNQASRSSDIVTLPIDSKNGSNGSESDGQNYIQLVGGNAGESLRAPVYDHKQFDPDAAASGFAKFTPRLREVLKSSGLNANERTHVMPIRDSQGNKIILPIKEFELTPTKWEGYQ